MRTLRIALALLCGAALAAAASPNPQEVSFQGKLLDSNNNPRNGTADFVFAVFNDATAGTQLWSETQNGVTVTNGVFSVRLGAVTALSPALFDRATAYLRVQVDPDAGGPLGQETLAPRTKLITAPYAMQAMALSGNGDVYIHAGGLVYSTFTATGNLLVPNGVQASSADISGLLLASSATLTASGPAVYSVTSSSGILMNGGILSLPVGSQLSFGLVTSSHSVSAAAIRVWCGHSGANTQGLVVLHGGCRGGGTRTANHNFPSTDATSGTALGSMLSNGATTGAKSWSCGFSAADAGNVAFVTCARIGN